MSERLDKAIQEIAIKHGVVLGKDDPILILQTMNDRLLEETRQAQAEMLVQFREEMERISSRWKDDAKEKAENVLNAALNSSKEVLSRLIQESTNESIKIMKKMILDSVDEVHKHTQRAKKFSRIALFSSTAMMAGSCLFMLLFILQF
ncbi:MULTISPECIES: conjugal transfer protein TraM [unclassified Legionella]|uniref:conjugal transfer protein TraM n=1 Tax=unclassified Legionella TaxID=2622702 RepID=UPI0010543E35|nr:MULTISPECIES: conjugal transfer protein TraM [unclassified Legionella]MDI9818632.1 conjugal transfer protein TraM [Legionella sp. PL877]